MLTHNFFSASGFGSTITFQHQQKVVVLHYPIIIVIGIRFRNAPTDQGTKQTTTRSANAAANAA